MFSLYPRLSKDSLQYCGCFSRGELSSVSILYYHPVRCDYLPTCVRTQLHTCTPNAFLHPIGLLFHCFPCKHALNVRVWPLRSLRKRSSALKNISQNLSFLFLIIIMEYYYYYYYPTDLHLAFILFLCAVFTFFFTVLTDSKEPSRSKD